MVLFMKTETKALKAVKFKSYPCDGQHMFVCNVKHWAICVCKPY